MSDGVRTSRRHLKRRRDTCFTNTSANSLDNSANKNKRKSQLSALDKSVGAVVHKPTNPQRKKRITNVNSALRSLSLPETLTRKEKCVRQKAGANKQSKSQKRQSNIMDSETTTSRSRISNIDIMEPIATRAKNKKQNRHSQPVIRNSKRRKTSVPSATITSVADHIYPGDPDSSSEEASGSESDSSVVSDSQTGLGGNNGQPLLRIPTYTTDSESEFDDEVLPVEPDIHVQPTSQDDNIVRQATDRHLNTITGGQSEFDNTPLFAEPISAPISAQMSKKIRRKIWAKQYVDFATLLPNYNTQPVQQRFSLQLGHNSMFNLVPQAQLRKITNISQWTSAFLRFVAVYSEKFPQETPQLMKYAEVVRDLAHRRPGLAWYYYDVQFRQLKETVNFRWDRIYYDLWVPSATMSPSTMGNSYANTNFQYTNANSQYSNAFSQRYKRLNNYANPNNTSSQRRTDQPFLRNCCWAFNRSGSCTRVECRFPHSCGQCRGPHSAKKLSPTGQKWFPSIK